MCSQLRQGHFLSACVFHLLSIQKCSKYFILNLGPRFCAQDSLLYETNAEANIFFVRPRFVQRYDTLSPKISQFSLHFLVYDQTTEKILVLVRSPKLRTMPTLLLCIRSAHLEILGFPMGGVYYYRDNSTRFKTVQRKQNLASALGIQKEILG